MNKLFEIDNLRCSYDRNYMEGVSKVVLEIRHLDIPVGKKVFIVGESGIGKSTILEVLGLMNNTIVPQDDARFVFYDDNGEDPSTPFESASVPEPPAPVPPPLNPLIC